MEMQSHLELVTHAWNLAILPKEKEKEKEKYELQKYLKKQKPYAPSPEALKDLEAEYKRIIAEKRELFPKVLNEIKHGEAVETSKDNYVIRAIFA